MFDSSYDAVLPYPNLFPEGFPFPVAPGVPIEGFYQGLTQMQPGGRYRLFIPAELGYGENPPPGGPIPPGSDLYFWVELVEFMPREVFEQKVAGALPAQR